MNSSIGQTALKSAGLVRRTLPNQTRSSSSQGVQLHHSTIQQQIHQRNLHTSPIPMKDEKSKATERTINRESLDPSRAEGTLTGTDDEVAHHDAPFDPSNTAPESEIEATGRESAERKKWNNPLDVSAGNREVNKTRDPSQDPPDRGADRPASARGWTRKGKVVNQVK